MTPAAIKELAVRFRELIDESDRSQWGASFEDFPNGSCAAVAEMFGTYLFKRCGVNAKYVSAVHRDGHHPHASHAWLELDDLIVDLTCDQDQFPEPLTTPYVEKDSAWHSQWSAERKETDMDERLESDCTRMFADWGIAYQSLLEQLDRS
jgi:hypothetical protein